MSDNTLQQANQKCLRDFDENLADYRQPSPAKSLWQLCSTLALYFAGWTAMVWSAQVSVWLTILFLVPTSMLIVRLFIIQHDCGHRSYFQTKRVNDMVGSWLGILTFTPYFAWRREHAAHHATSGDLDRRGKGGEIWTLTVQEYREASLSRRIKYRLYRNPLVLFGIGPFYHFIFHQRFAFVIPKVQKKERRSVHWTNLGLLTYSIVMSCLIGPLQFLMLQLPLMLIASSVGVWLFYVQHQYEDAFWESGEDWDYVQAALDGSSYYRLPKILQWFTGNIGLHHIHHLDLRIPNYNLQPCHDDNPEFQEVRQLSLRESLLCINVKLWDEEQRKMVGFSAV